MVTPRSSEETDLLERSTKKSKTNNDGVETESVEIVMDSLNPEVNNQSQQEEFCADEEEEDCPTIRVAKAKKYRLRQPWRQTLIVKVMGRTIGYNSLLRRIKALWRPKSFH
ncbi:hypothetical protein DITRI_Ditri19aG0055600 [Diplodiscus trichospermus]